MELRYGQVLHKLLHLSFFDALVQLGLWLDHCLYVQRNGLSLPQWRCCQAPSTLRGVILFGNLRLVRVEVVETDLAKDAVPLH